MACCISTETHPVPWRTLVLPFSTELWFILCSVDSSIFLLFCLSFIASIHKSWSVLLRMQAESKHRGRPRDVQLFNQFHMASLFRRQRYGIRSGRDLFLKTFPALLDRVHYILQATSMVISSLMCWEFYFTIIKALMTQLMVDYVCENSPRIPPNYV